MTQVKAAVAPQSGPAHGHTGAGPPVLAHTLPLTCDQEPVSVAGVGVPLVSPPGQKHSVSSKAEVLSSTARKHKQAQLPETELLVTGDAVNTPGKGP